MWEGKGDIRRASSIRTGSMPKLRWLTTRGWLEPQTAEPCVGSAMARTCFQHGVPVHQAVTSEQVISPLQATVSAFEKLEGHCSSPFFHYLKDKARYCSKVPRPNRAARASFLPTEASPAKMPMCRLCSRPLAFLIWEKYKWNWHPGPCFQNIKLRF